MVCLRIANWFGPDCGLRTLANAAATPAAAEACATRRSGAAAIRPQPLPGCVANVYPPESSTPTGSVAHSTQDPLRWLSKERRTADLHLLRGHSKLTYRMDQSSIKYSPEINHSQSSCNNVQCNNVRSLCFLFIGETRSAL